MADYKQLVSRVVKDENNKIERVRHNKQVNKLTEAGFSRSQAEILLECGVEPKVSVKTYYNERIPGNEYTQYRALHADEEKWLDIGG